MSANQVQFSVPFARAYETYTYYWHCERRRRAGLNPVIRAIVRASINEHGMRVVGVLNGFDGLIWPEGAKEMTEESVMTKWIPYRLTRHWRR
jgi:hypothetical protein